MSRPQFVVAAAAAVTVCLASASTSHATLKLYDPFFTTTNATTQNLPSHVGEYTVGALDPSPGFGGGQNGGTGATLSTPQTFFNGGWFRRSSGDAPRTFVRDQGLSYLGSDALGGSAWIDRSTGAPLTDANGRIARRLADPLNASKDGTYFLSFAINYGTANATQDNQSMGYRAFEMRNVAGSTDIGGDGDWIGYNTFNGNLGPVQQAPQTARLAAFISNQYVILENAPDSFLLDGATHLVVVRFNMSSTSTDSISIYLDPTNNVLPDLPSATISGLNYELGSLSIANSYGGEGGTDISADEMRFSEAISASALDIQTAYAEVIPELPLPGDCNGDGFVTIEDYNIIAANYNQPTPNGPMDGDVANSNAGQGTNGRVDIADYRLWRDNYNPPAGSGGLAGVGIPEPSTFILTLLASVPLLGGRRRKNRVA